MSIEEKLVPYRAVAEIAARSVLVFAPHPDDEVFGCGGALCLHARAGVPVQVVVVTDGALGLSGNALARHSSVREAECFAAATRLGYPSPTFWRLRDQGIEYGEYLIGRMAEAIVQSDADLVYAPALTEMHPDHRIVAMAAMEAVRRVGGERRLAMYEVGVAQYPNVLLDISGVFDDKRAAIQCFTSQLAQQNYGIHIESLNRFRTYTLSTKAVAAEAFRIHPSSEIAAQPTEFYQPEFLRQKGLGLAVSGERDFPRVSVLIRSDGGAGLRAALDAVALQTYGNIEVLVAALPGAKLPNLGETCGRYALRTIAAPAARHAGDVANALIGAASGEWWALLDDDGRFTPDHVQSLVELTRAHPEAALAYSGVAIEGPRHQAFGVVTGDYAHLREMAPLLLPVQALLVSRAAFAKVGGTLSTTRREREAWDIWLALECDQPFAHHARITAILRRDKRPVVEEAALSADESRRDMEIRLARAERQAAAERRRLDQMGEQVAGQDHEIARLKLRIEAADTTAESLRAALGDADRRNFESGQRVGQLENELFGVRGVLGQVREELARAGELVTEREQWIHERELKLIDQREQIAHRQALLDQAEQRVAAGELARTELEQQIAGLQGEMASLQARLAESEMSIGERDQQLAQLDGDLVDARCALEAAEGRCAVLHDRLGTLAADLDRERAKVVALRQELRDRLEAQALAHANELAAQQSAHDAAIAAQIAVSDREAAVAAQVLAGLEAQFADTRRRLLTADDQLADAGRRLQAGDQLAASLQGEIRDLERRLADQAEGIANRDRELHWRAQVIDARDRHLAEALRSLHEYRNSTSWRVTAPLRYVVHQLRRVAKVVRTIRRAIGRKGGVLPTAAVTARVLATEGPAGVVARLRQEAHRDRPLLAAELPAVQGRGGPRFVPHYVDPNVDRSPVTAAWHHLLGIHLHVPAGASMTGATERLAKLPFAFDLYVSLADAGERRAVVQLRSALPRARTVAVEEVAADTHPMVAMVACFGQHLAGCDIVAHLRADAVADLDKIVSPRDGSGGRVEHLLELLRERAKLVYLDSAPGWDLPGEDVDARDPHVGLASRLLAGAGAMALDDFPSTVAPAGGAFWARQSAVKPFLALPLALSEARQGTTPSMALERLLIALAAEAPGDFLRLTTVDAIPDFRYYEPQRDYSALNRHPDVKVLAYYLPQFHPIPENDEWHGAGFTEWTKVRAADPLFAGHYQQHIPHPDIGYYLLDSPATLAKQAELMRQSGVYGQVFYHYWFTGKLILEEPAQMLLANPDIAMPFCFCWANENWTRRWDGNESEILLGQNYSTDDARNFIRYLIPFFKDARYIKVDGRPMLYVYRPSSIPDCGAYLKVWEEECQRAGLARPYMVAVLTRGAVDPRDFGMDAGVERVLHDWTDGQVANIVPTLDTYQPLQANVLPYGAVADFYAAQGAERDFTYFRSITPIWDNTARYGERAYALHGSTPALFQSWMRKLVEQAEAHLPADRRFVLVNAWNEWAEGAHLEPDTRYGYAYLNSVGRVLADRPFDGDPGEATVPATTRLFVEVAASARAALRHDSSLAQRFYHCLARSGALRQCEVSTDAEELAERLGFTSGGQAACDRADYILQIREIALFEADTIEKLLSTATAVAGSAVMANPYGRIEDPLAVCENGSVAADTALKAHLLLLPVAARNHRRINVRLRSDAHTYLAPASDLPVEARHAVTTVIRFHKSGDLPSLRGALYCLLAMQDCLVRPLIAAQDLSERQRGELIACLADFPWFKGYEPVVEYHESPGGRGDLRSRMLNESLRAVRTRYAGILDFDDLLFPHAYRWLIGRMRSQDKAIAFGRVFSTAYDGDKGLILERKRSFQYGYSYDEFVGHNHAPTHSFLIDAERVDFKVTVYHDDQRYMEDYLLALQIFRRDNADWEGLKDNMYVGDYIHSIQRAHTLAISDEAERERLLNDPLYQRCERYIQDMRRQVQTT